MSGGHDTFQGRLFLLLMIALVGSALVVLGLSDASHRRHLRQAHLFGAAERVGDLTRQAVETDGVVVGARPAAVAAPGRADPALTRAVASALARRGVRDVTAQAYEAPSRACGSAAGHREGCRLLRLTVPEGSGALSRNVDVAVTLPPEPRPLGADGVLIGVLLALLGALSLLAWWAARHTAGPLRRLAVAATALGENLDRPPLTEEGSTEVREAAQAFNAMQTRLRAMLEDRTRMLAAITHDLQTPLTRARLRVEKIEDAELRTRLIADLAATQALIREGLDLARMDAGPEPWAATDLDSLVAALCEDAADAGQPVRFTGGCGGAVRTRPQALQRCLANLVDNAVKHAGVAALSCARTEGRVVVAVRDHGPGLPPDRIDALFEPFARLDPSRSRDSGGVGLGLTIARRMAERAGATLVLKNHPQGGLIAEVSLPT